MSCWSNNDALGLVILPDLNSWTTLVHLSTVCLCSSFGSDEDADGNDGEDADGSVGSVALDNVSPLWELGML